MTKPPHEVRSLSGEDQLRDAHTLFRSAMHDPRVDDELWAFVLDSYDGATVLGAFDDSGMIGTLAATDSVIALPGGKVVPMAAVSRVGVRADRTRRGVLTSVMRTFLEGVSAPLASLRATEGSIYRRYGYGVATRYRKVQLDRTARFHDQVQAAGEVRLVQDQDEVRRLVPGLTQRFGAARPGGVILSDGYWRLTLRREGFVRLVLHEDGFAVFKTKHVGDHYGHRLEVLALFAATPAATVALWSFLRGLDLVDTVVAEGRPVDEDLDLLLVDPRACRYTEIEDETWLRLVDVPAALSVRAYGPAEPVVLEVVDELLPANSGRYLVGPDGAERTDRDPQLRLGVADLAAAYLGDRPLSRFAAAGRVEVADRTALADADRLFRLDEAPWCGTYF
ncbi:GNAT family N-acetyltransferase [Kutzneria sp. NPDC052558]|uniref:GNAT family N-acetyltransferase n=1 Tax=Kutzneria sp. NPDC052558 TaxID=3364121 RepID=UPI0037C828D6